MTKTWGDTSAAPTRPARAFWTATAKASTAGAQSGLVPESGKAIGVPCIIIVEMTNLGEGSLIHNSCYHIILVK